MVQFNVSEMRTQAESMNKFDSLLEAGAWLPVKTKADQETVETISARHYSHPALPNRKVVQIAAERTGIAEDRALDVLASASIRSAKHLPSVVAGRWIFLAGR